MDVSIDLGGSTIDIVSFSDPHTIDLFKSIPSSSLDKSNLGEVLECADIDVHLIDRIVMTGGHTSSLPAVFMDKRIQTVDEIDSIGAGGLYLSNLDEALVISMGTGICMVKASKGQYAHVGGTGVGGGTLIGLSSLLIDEQDPATICELANQGDLGKVDLSVADIVGGGIGIIPGFATAANFGKLDGASKADIALGICNLIGQTIASLAHFAAQKHNLENIILAGRLHNIQVIVDIMKKTASMYKRNIIIPDKSEYSTAIGALYTLYN